MVMALLITFLVLLGASYVFYFFHSSYRLYARFCLDWETRAQLYEQSFERLAALQAELGDQSTELIAMLLRHDVAGLRFCSKHANKWRMSIPRRFRDYYLRSSQCGG